jgi:hypothetical protein
VRIRFDFGALKQLSPRRTTAKPLCNPKTTTDMINRTLIICILTLMIFTACNSFSGKIEKNQSCANVSHAFTAHNGAKDVYLINTSKSDKITFTVESNQKVYRGSLSSTPRTEVRTRTHTLNPGERIHLGCEAIAARSQAQWNIRQYKIVGALKE